jgi:hypothetical protein
MPNFVLVEKKAKILTTGIQKEGENFNHRNTLPYFED